MMAFPRVSLDMPLVYFGKKLGFNTNHGETKLFPLSLILSAANEVFINIEI